MASMKDLVGRDCGGVNPLMNLASHFSQDQSHQQEGFNRRYDHPAYNMPIVPFENATQDQLVNEFLMNQPQHQAPSTFRMDALLQEMQQLDGARERMMSAPPVADLILADHWTNEFEKAGNSGRQLDNNWESEFLGQAPSEFLGQIEQNPLHFQQPTHVQQPTASLWARDFLEQTEHQQWEDEFKESTSELKKADEDLTPEELAIRWMNEHDKDGEEEYWEHYFKSFPIKPKPAPKLGSDPESCLNYVDYFDKFNYDYLEKYEFADDNPLYDHPDPFAEGLSRLEKGDISNAVLLFEAAVRNDPNAANVWYYLGLTQQDNEWDLMSLAALRRCLELDPGNLNALIALATGYINEQNFRPAYNALFDWIKNNPKYSHLAPKTWPLEDPSLIRTHEVIRDTYIAAVQTSATEIDADLQIGLGVMFSAMGEWDKAVDCFKVAVQVRPNDHRIWNKVGATLANGKRSEEAVEAYHHGLNICSGNIRTRYNLGIACINLGAYKESVEHFLSTLNLQRNSRGLSGEKMSMSFNIWNLLRTALTLYSQSNPSYMAALDKRDLDFLNREFAIQV